MNKKGFTLVEVLAVIVIIGILGTIAVVSVTVISSKNKEKIYNSKVDSIELAAVTYIQDNKNIYNEKKGNNNCIYLSINFLLDNNYIKKDNNNCDESSTCIEDPRTKGEYLDGKFVKIELKNNQFVATYFASRPSNCTKAY